MFRLPPPSTNCHTFSDPSLSWSVAYFMNGSLNIYKATLSYSDALDLRIPRMRSATAQYRSVAYIGPSACNCLPLLHNSCAWNYCTSHLSCSC